MDHPPPVLGELPLREHTGLPKLREASAETLEQFGIVAARHDDSGRVADETAGREGTSCHSNVLDYEI